MFEIKKTTTEIKSKKSQGKFNGEGRESLLNLAEKLNEGEHFIVPKDKCSYSFLYNQLRDKGCSIRYIVDGQFTSQYDKDYTGLAVLKILK